MTSSDQRRDAKILRAQAEATFHATLASETEQQDADLPDATKRVLYELRVHQIELEMQNEELRRTQMELSESRARYFDLYDLAPVGYVTLNSAGLIQQSNLTATQLLGMTRAELDQRPITRFIREESSNQFYLLRKALVSSGQSQSAELQFVKRGSEPFWVYLEATSAEEDGELVIRVVLSDITARKQTELEHGRLERKVQEMQKLESLGVLAGGIAHDFNNLLTIILGNSNLAAQEVPVGSPTQIHLQSIDEAAHRAADLCKQMLDYSGRGRFVLQRLAFNELVETTAQMLKQTISRKAEMRFNLDRELPPVLADATQLRQVIMNLVINASEAIVGPKGVIVLTTGLTRFPQRITEGAGPVAELPEGEYMVFEVSDNGCGMDPNTQARIFDPFFSTKFSGRGLGLAVVSGIVRGHNGALTVESRIGQGTTFRLFIPAVGGLAEKPRLNPGGITPTKAPSRGPATEIWQGSGTVLVVDDEETIRMVIGQVLNLSGLEPVLAADGRAALELFQADPDRFDLVILDLTMPRMGGEEAFLEMQKLRPNVRVVLMSGYDQYQALIHFPRNGPVGFLSKPFTVEHFRAVLEDLLG